MDQLAADQQEQLIKCSTERLRLKLVQAGVAEQVVSDMDRPRLLDTLAQKMSTADLEMIDKDRTTGDPVTELRLREIELEEKRIEAGREIRRLEVENRRLDAEREAEQERRRMELEVEAEKEREIRKLEAERERMKLEAEMEARMIDMEMKKMELEKEIKILELRGIQERDTENSGEVEERSGPAQGWYESLAGRTKRLGETLRHVCLPCPLKLQNFHSFYRATLC